MLSVIEDNAGDMQDIFRESVRVISGIKEELGRTNSSLGSNRESVRSVVAFSVVEAWKLVVQKKGIQIPHHRGLLSTDEVANARYVANSNLREVYEDRESFNLKSFFLICGELRRLCIIIARIALFIFMPIYILLKRVKNGEYSTHEFQYLWIISGAMM